MKIEASAERRTGQGWRRLAEVLWLALCAFFILLALASNIQEARHSIFGRQGFGDPGAQMTPDPADGRNVVVDRVTPLSPLARLGIAPGAHLRLDAPWDNLRVPFAGERLELVRTAPAPVLHAVVIVPQDAGMAASQPGWSTLYPSVARFLLLAAGLFIVWRGWRGSSLMLGMAFVCASSCPPSFWPISPAAFPFWLDAIRTGWTASPWLLLGFAIRYNTENAQPLRAWESYFWRATAGFTAVAVVFFEVTHHRIFTPLILPILAWPGPVVMLAAFSYLVRGWLGSNAETRTRYAVMLIALPVSFSGNFIYSVLDIGLTTGVISASNAPQWLVNITDVGRYAGPMLFAYAIFRHRVLNLGFAVNRAVVYGVVSAILLVAFGLLEWLSEHVIPIEGREKNVLIDAGIALAVFLTFHRVRDFVEHYIEAWFFRSWHTNEAALKRFVAEAGFIGRPDALVGAFAAEIRRFTGADGAVYLRDEAGVYRLAQGALPGAPELIDPDDPAPIALRAHRAPQELDGATAARLSAILALPLSHRNDLPGFVLLAARPRGDLYRPDEIELLGWAAHQVALDLHALRVEALEEVVAEHRQREGVLEAQLRIALQAAHLTIADRGDVSSMA